MNETMYTLHNQIYVNESLNYFNVSVFLKQNMYTLVTHIVLIFGVLSLITYLWNSFFLLVSTLPVDIPMSAYPVDIPMSAF